jgi:hypothetical protein
MEANRVLLTLVLRDADLRIGAAAAERLCTSMGRLGIAMRRDRADVAPETRHTGGAEAPLAITVAFQGGTITFALNAP